MTETLRDLSGHEGMYRVRLQKVTYFQRTKETAMNIHLSLAPLVSLIAGVLILIAPRLLNYIVAAYLIAVGVLGLIGDVHLR